MTKQMFEITLRDSLGSRRLPQEEIARSVEFYLEMIDDRIEDGMEEEAAVEALGSPQDLAEQILSEQAWHTVLGSKVKHTYEKSKAPVLKTLFWVLSPVWIGLLLAFGVLILALYITEVAVLILSAVGVFCIGACGVAGIGMSVLIFVQAANPATALAFLGIGIFMIGALILILLPAKAILRVIWDLHKLLWRTLKKMVWGVGKEAAK